MEHGVVGCRGDDLLTRHRHHWHLHVSSQRASSGRGSSPALAGDECPPAVAGCHGGGGNGIWNVLGSQWHRRRRRHIFPLVTGHFPKRPVVVVRRALACAFIISTALALYTASIVGFVVKFLPLTMSGLAVIIMLGRFWKRATWQGAVGALIATPAVVLAVMFIPAQAKFWGNPTIPAVVVGIIARSEERRVGKE